MREVGGVERIKWVFLDVGSTLIDETACYVRRIRDAVAGTEHAFEDVWKLCVEFAKENRAGDREALARLSLPKTPWHSEDETPYPDAQSVLDTLKHRGYRVGIIANQGAGLGERLAAWGLLSYIEIIVSSAEEGVAKPDAAIFRRALARAGCLPHEAVMIGDRIDNDIAPAKAMGMHAIHMRQGFGAHHAARCDAQRADCTVDSLTEILDILK